MTAGIIGNSAVDRRAAALEEATKIYGLGFALRVASGNEEISADNIEEDILDIANRLDYWLWGGNRKMVYTNG